MAEINNVIAEASQDLQTIEDFVNLPAGSDVRPRLLPSVNVGTLAGTRDAIFRAGGLPAEPFATKANMETDGAALPDGQLAQVYDDTDNNGLYVKTAGVWTKTSYSPMLQSDVREEIDVFANTILNKGKNLFDANAATIGKFINVVGNLSDNALHAVSDFIPVYSDETYTLSGSSLTSPPFNTVSYFSSDKSFISRIAYDTAGAKTFTPPVGAAYIRLNIYNALPSENERMLNMGTEALPYEAYTKPTLNNIYLNSDNIKQLEPELAKAVRGSDITSTKVSGSILNTYEVEEGVLESGTGLVVPPSSSDTFYTAPYARITPSTGYLFITTNSSINRLFRVAFYDYDKNFVGDIDLNSAEDVTLSPSQVNGSDTYVAKRVVSSASAVYARITLRHLMSVVTDSGDIGVFKEDGFVKVMPYGVTLPTLNFSDSTNKLLQKRTESSIVDMVFQPKINLFNANDVSIGLVLKDDGSIAPSEVYAVSGFIPVEPDTLYYQRHKREVGQATTQPFIHVAFFDINKRFLYRKINTDDTFKTNNSTHFIRVNTNAGLPTEHERMLTKGTPPAEYVPYVYKINPEILPKSDTVVQANNLFDFTKIEYGIAISSDGGIAENKDYSTSEFIEVDPNNTYVVSDSAPDSISGFRYISTYNANKIFLKRIVVNKTTYNSKGFIAVQFDNDVKYVRLSHNQGRSREHGRMFNRGSSPLPYDKGIDKLSGLTLSEATKNAVLTDMGYRLKERSYTDMPFNGVWNSTQTNEELTQFAGWQSNKHTDVHALYELLRSKYPNYIKKKLHGVDDWGNEFLTYTFIPEVQVAELKPKRAKIFICASIHGHEHAPALSTYLMMQQICDNWTSDPLLEALRFNVEFVIVPVANLSGYDDYTNKNRNGVNLNRSFTPYFGAQASGDPSHDQYGGEDPFQEKETQFIAQVFDDHPDMDVCYDFHNFGSGSTWRYMWTPTGDDPQMERLSYKWQNRMSHKFAKDLDFLPKDEIIPLGQINYSYPSGMLKNYAYLDRGVELATTVEVARMWNLESGLVAYDTTSCRTLTEVITNLVLITADTLTKP